MNSYTGLSELMARHPEVFVVRTFESLQVKNLLYYQAELAELEEELAEVEAENYSCPEAPRKDFSRHWKSLTETGSSCIGQRTSRENAKNLQWQLMLRARETLAEYNHTLEQYLKLRSMLHRPKSTSLKRLREWLSRSAFGDSFLAGTPEDVWDVEKGFVDYATGKHDDENVLTFHLAAGLTYLESWMKRKSQPKETLHGMASASVQRMNNVIVTIISSIFPVLPIIVLFFIDSILIRLGLVLLFTACFALVLVFNLEIPPATTLTITTAFAAIQVVFVGSTHSGIN